MKKTKLFYFLVSVLVLSIVLSGCGSGEPKDQTDAEPAETDEKVPDSDTSAEATDDEGEAGDEELEPYTFTHYFNYDYWDIKPWGEDEVSKVLKEKFNVDIEFSKPESDPEAQLNIMISAGDLPDSIMMDGINNVTKLVELDMLHPLEPLMENNSNYEENLDPETIEMLKIDGNVYGIPNWPRTQATGGNDVWLYNKRLYEAAGSPDLTTFEGLYEYATTIKNEVPETKEGLPTIPFSTDASSDGHAPVRAFYRSHGGVLNGWYTVVDGKYQFAFRDPLFKEVALEVNKWWREGLFAETQFTDTVDQILEKLVEGRIALTYYDHSQDDVRKFRKILMENHPDDSYEVVEPPFPPAKGLSPDDVYGEIYAGAGWNGTYISKDAENPQRIFDVWTYLYTPEAALLQMYGPQGELWDELDDEGRPLLKKPESELTSEEVNRLGLWFWMIPGHADHVDNLKFAVNEMQPEEKRSWVISTQKNILTPTMQVSNEFFGIGDSIDPQSDEGIKRTTCEDHIGEEFPKMLMANSQEEAEKIYQEIIDFCDNNGMPEIEEIYNKKYQENVEIGGTALTKGRYAE